MSAELSAADPYEAVLADLHAQRDRIDQAIQVIRNMRAASAALAGLPPVPSQSDSPMQNGSGPTLGGVSGSEGDLLGMTIADAAVKTLTARRRVMGNAELYAAFKQGGLILTSAEPINVINSVLTRRFAQVGDIVRVDRGQWGLQQWYPGRSFKKKVKGAEMDATSYSIDAGPIVPEQPSTPPATSPDPLE